MKKILLATALLSIISITAHANPPTKCPNIKQSALSWEYILEVHNQEWMTMLINNFDYDHEWALTVSPITATDKNDAINKANAMIKSTSFSWGPLPITSREQPKITLWYCIYPVADSFIATYTFSDGKAPALSEVKNLNQTLSTKI